MKYKLGDLTVKNWNDWDRVPRDPVSIGTAIAGAIGVTSTVGTYLIIGATYLAIGAVTSWALAALAPKQDFGSLQSNGILVNSREAAAPQDYVYGEVRKGGTVVFYETSGSENKYLHQVIVLAGHEVNSIGDIYINDEVANINGSNFVTTAGSTDWQSKIRIKKHTGSQTTYDTDLASETTVGPNFIGNDIAYLYVRYEYDQDVFANGVPLITAKVQGKKVYDPRTATTGYSNNAALCIRDFLTTSYGLNDSSIDDVAFSAAANECAESIALDAGGTESRYTINGIVRADRPIGSVLQDMITACASTLFWGVGAWKLKVGAYTSSVKTLTLDDLRGPISLDTRITMRDNFNTVRGTFIDANQDYITADYPELTSSTFKTEDGGEEVALDLALPFTTSSATAQRLAKLTLYRAREQMTINADFGLAAMEVEVGDIIAFTNDRYGFDAKEFEVMGWRLSPNQDAGDLRINLTLRETSEAAFDWNAEETDILSNNTTLPVYTAGMTVLNLSANEGGRTQSDGTRISTALIDWDDVDSAFIERYEVQWKPTADSSYSTTYTSNSAIELSPIIDSVEYTFRVRAIAVNGYRGPFTSVTLTGGGDSTAPNPPTNVSAVGGYKYIIVSFDLPADNDFSYVEVFEDTDNLFAGAASIGRTSGNTFVRAGLPNDATRYYWVKAFDLSGNASSVVGPVSATTALIEGADLTTSLLDTIEQAGVNAVNSLPATGDYENQIVFLLTDFTLYRWTGSAWSDTLYTGIKDGSITETKITNNSISTPKLQANSIVAEKISANAVVSDKIAAQAIVASKIAAGAITADKLSSNELSSHYAVIGTFESATSGARLRLEDDKITVYDSSGVVRVKIGNLA